MKNYQEFQSFIRPLPFLIFFVFLQTSFSCKNNKLTREKAAEIISKNFPRKVYNQFCYGKFSSGLGLRNQTIKDLQNERLINLSEQNGEVYGFGMFQSVHYEITVPDNLKQYIGEIYKAKSLLSYCGEGRNDDKTMCLVKIGEQSFVGITGIHEISEQEAEVEYTWTFTNSTPFAKVFKSYILFIDERRGMTETYYYNSKIVQSEKILMQKFDDGWRLSNPFNYPVMYKQAADPVDEYPPVPTGTSNNQPEPTKAATPPQQENSTPQQSASDTTVNLISYNGTNGKLVFKNDCFVIITGSFGYETDAINEVKRIKNQGYSNAGYLWIPDYPSLSGKQFYAPYIGPFASYSDCENNLRNLAKTGRFWYGIKVSYQKERVEIR